jgi:hypothetical protein
LFMHQIWHQPMLSADMICIATACAKRASNIRLLAQALSKSSDFLICAECKS